MDFLDLLTDDVLRDALGPEVVNQGYAALASGKVIRRLKHPNGVISASWENDFNSPMMQAKVDEDNLLTVCTCKQFRREGTCEHIAALLVAWASESMIGSLRIPVTATLRMRAISRSSATVNWLSTRR